MKWLDAYEEKLKAATRGPWELREKKVSWTLYELPVQVAKRGVGILAETYLYSDHPAALHNAAFIAASPEMVAKLLAAVRAAEEALECMVADCEGQPPERMGPIAWGLLGHAQTALAKLQSGSLGEGDEVIGNTRDHPHLSNA